MSTHPIGSPGQTKYGHIEKPCLEKITNNCDHLVLSGEESHRMTEGKVEASCPLAPTELSSTSKLPQPRQAS